MIFHSIIALWSLFSLMGELSPLGTAATVWPIVPAPDER
jgi:hypothetical protein